MARRARKELPGGLAHVTCRTIRRYPMFRTERDAFALLDLLDYETRRVDRLHVLAYCLMPNHVHYVMDASIEQLSSLMHRVNGRFAQRFNREHGYRGHLFQGRFHAKPIVDESHLPASLRYVVLNPVRAGLCEQPDRWRWSSYRGCLGLEPARRFLDIERALSLFGPDLAASRGALRAFVEDDLPSGTVPGTVPDAA